MFHFFKEVPLDIDNVWERIKKGLKDGAALSMDKIEEYTKVGKLKIEEFSAKKKIERNFIDIGERVFELVSDEKTKDVEKDILISNAVENVKTLQDELIEIEKRIEEISEEHVDSVTDIGNEDDDDDEITGI